MFYFNFIYFFCVVQNETQTTFNTTTTDFNITNASQYMIIMWNRCIVFINRKVEIIYILYEHCVKFVLKMFNLT